MDIPPQDDGFKWFGEGFDGFPKKLPDDCVEYAIYIIDEKLRRQESALRSRLKDIQNAANALIKTLLKGYIWQRDAFALDLVHPHKLSEHEEKPLKDASPHPYFLRGRTNFGDSIADEWLIVYLLRELSKKFPDAWVRVYDTDGEFLLIEAANALPKWLNPDIAEHRVWINKGQLRIIPLQRDAVEGSGPKTPGLPASVTLGDAISFITATPASVPHFQPIEDEAFYRLHEYPSAVETSMHHAVLSIPRKLAYILHSNPSYISPAIESFYLRDPIAVKPLSTKDTGTLTFAPEDFVQTSVKFTKVLFAQLHSQDFGPPPSWTSVRPRIDDRRVSLGMKLACGFEMLVRDPQNRDRRAVREIQLLLDDVDAGDDALPTDAEVACWGSRQDDDGWLDISFEDFEKELDGRNRQGGAGQEREGAAGGAEAPSPAPPASGSAAANNKASAPASSGFGDPAAQANLRKLVSRFEDFIADDDEAGGPDSSPSSSAPPSDASDSDSDSDGEDKDGSFTDAEFERAMREMMGMPAADVEASGLLDEARRLALEMEDDEEGARDDEEEEVKEIMRRMEKELKGHGALDLDGKAEDKEAAAAKKRSTRKTRDEVRESIAEETLRGMNGAKGKAKSKAKAKGKQKVQFESDDEESSADEDLLGDVDVDLLRNMLEAFKGQAGMAGPAGNLMNLMGVKMPRDESGSAGGRVEDDDDAED